MDAETLKKIPIFADVDERDLRVVTTFARLDEVAPGQVVVREGDYANDFMAIEEGSAVVKRDGEEIGRLETGEIFGEVGLIEGERRSATVVAETRLRLIKIEHWELYRLRKVLPQVYERIEALAEERRGDAG